VRATQFYPRLLRFLRPHRWRLAGTIAFNLIASALDGYAFALLIPFLNALFKQQALPVTNGWVKSMLSATIGALLDEAHPMTSLRNVLLVILGVVAVKNVFVYLAGALGAQLQEYVTRDLRDALYTHLLALPIRFFTSTKVGQILSRVLADTEQTKSLVTEIVTRGVGAGSQIAVALALMFGISWRLSLISLIIAPLLTLVLQPVLRRLRHGYRVLRNDHGEMMSVMQESITGVRLVKSYGAEAYEDRRFLGASHKYSGGLVRMARLAVLAQPITEVLGMVIVAILMWVGAREVLFTQTLQASEFLVFVAVVMRLLQPMKQLSQLPAIAQNSFASAERIFQVLDHPTECALDKGTITTPAFRERLEFDHVSFAYDDEAVLSDISFTAKKGDVIALVGASGAGKSTLVDLIPRFYEPASGRITIDGVDTKQITVPALRALTGIVSQETVIFNDTVRANIAYGRAGTYTDAQVEAAARAANAHEFIRELPAGYDTVLGERGARLSGGQRQRIAIARALLLDPPILILDEATSALDTESERLVQEAIDRLLAGRTVFVIAHRLSTIQHATEILVLDRGRVIERGTHDDLLARRGAYFRLHSLQFGERERPVPA
jgi:subfamily B ATP-binding cassette protein MsbA